MDEEAILVYEYIFCKSCGGMGTIDHSHNLPRGLFKQYELERWNISHRCRECHNALDGHDFEKIKDFEDLHKIMYDRKEYEPGEYNKFVDGLREVGCMDYDFVELDTDHILT